LSDYVVSTESGSDRVTILAISIFAIGGDPVATALGTDLILKLRHYPSLWFCEALVWLLVDIALSGTHRHPG